jgi:hypothetical protein
MTASRFWQRLCTIGRRRSAARSRGRTANRRSAKIETLETRNLLAGLPFGADPDDTSEYMLGNVLVTLVLMESDGSVDESTEDWTPPGWTPDDGPTDRMQSVQNTVTAGIEWWEQTLAGQGSVHGVDFTFDYQYANVPVPTEYEPIANPYDSYLDWVPDFLRHADPTNSDPDVFPDMRAFNHAQRMAHGTDWAFTVFVVDSQNDSDNQFAGGDVRGAFAFPGGPFMVVPSRRSASVVAHETGHIFYALDEYAGGDPYTARRGYYNTQNLNADDDDNPHARVDSMMDDGAAMVTAYANHQASLSAMEMVGWKDTDSDGIFDVLDVAHTLEGTGAYDPAGGIYRFLGTSSVATLPNQNPYSYSLGNDITLNRIHRAEYRIDGGPWLEAATYDATQINLDLHIPHVPADATTIEIRTVDAASGVTSPVFAGDIDRPTSMGPPGAGGFVWLDLDSDGEREAGEPGLGGWTVRIDEADGPAIASAPTNDLGAFSFAGLEDGTYEVTVVAPAAWAGGAASPAAHTVTVAGGAAGETADFGVAQGGTSYWQNASDPHDVDGSGDVTWSDFSDIAEALEVYGVRDEPLPMIPPYVDTSGDGMLSLKDAVLVMRRLLGVGGGGPAPTRATNVGASPPADIVAASDPVLNEVTTPTENPAGGAVSGEGDAEAPAYQDDAGWRATGFVGNADSPDGRFAPSSLSVFFATPSALVFPLPRQGSMNSTVASVWREQASSIDDVFSGWPEAEWLRAALSWDTEGFWQPADIRGCHGLARAPALGPLACGTA